GIVARHTLSGAEPPDTARLPTPKISDVVIQQTVVRRQVVELFAVELRHAGRGCNPECAIFPIEPEYVNLVREQSVRGIVGRPMALLERSQPAIDFFGCRESG